MRRTLRQLQELPQILATDVARWHEARGRCLITATEASALFDVNPWLTYRELIRRKQTSRALARREWSSRPRSLSLVDDDAGVDTGSGAGSGTGAGTEGEGGAGAAETGGVSATSHGTYYEPIARRHYCERYGTMVGELGFRTTEDQLLGATPDGFDERQQCLVEYKCPLRRPITRQIPLNYWIQMQVQMHVWGVESCYYVESKYRPESDETLLDNWDYLVQYDPHWIEHHLMPRVHQFRRDLDALIAAESSRPETSIAVGGKRTRTAMETNHTGERMISSVEWLHWMQSPVVTPLDLYPWMVEQPILNWLAEYGPEDQKDPPQKFSILEYAHRQRIRYMDWLLQDLKRRIPTLRVKSVQSKVVKLPRNFAELPLLVKYRPDWPSFQATQELLRQRSSFDLILGAQLGRVIDQQLLLSTPHWILNSQIARRIFPESVLEHSGWIRDSWIPTQISFSTLQLAVDGHTLYNTPSQLRYKAQLLSALVGAQEPIGLQIGRTAQVNRSVGAGGPIFHTDWTRCVAKVEAGRQGRDGARWLPEFRMALDWIRTVRRDGHQWDPEHPECAIELVPRASSGDGVLEAAGWSKYCEHLSKLHDELTQLCHFGKKRRSESHERNIRRISQLPDELSQMFRNGTQLKMIQRILDAQRRNQILYDSARLHHEVRDFSGVEFYVDFETASDLYKLRSNGDNRAIIFLVGCLAQWSGPEGQVESSYRQFIARSLVPAAEDRMMRDWMRWMLELRRDHGRGRLELPVYHWSSHEEGVVKRKWRGAAFDHIQWIDLCEQSRYLGLGIPGCYNYGLKQIIKSLHAQGEVETTWPESDVSNGTEAMVAAFHGQEAIERGEIECLEQLAGFDELLEYNRVDCVVMAEILKAFRRWKNHSSN